MVRKAYQFFTTIFYSLIFLLILSDPLTAGFIPQKTGLQTIDFLIIWKAAVHNKCVAEDFLVLLAIRKAENGRPGREFGVLDPKCLAQIAINPEQSLEIQAGWATATIVKNRVRWNEAGRPGDFLEFLQKRYCPDEKEGKVWLKNVRYFFNQFKNECSEKQGS